MAKIFYDHLLVTEEITAELDNISLSDEERDELIHLIDETTHHHLLDAILSALPADQHSYFLTQFHQAPHDPKLLSFLKQHAGDQIEEMIRGEAGKLKSELLAEIKAAKPSKRRRAP